jgi:hypothetical protein
MILLRIFSRLSNEALLDPALDAKESPIFLRTLKCHSNFESLL